MIAEAKTTGDVTEIEAVTKTLKGFFDSEEREATKNAVLNSVSPSGGLRFHTHRPRVTTR